MKKNFCNNGIKSLFFCEKGCDSDSCTSVSRDTGSVIVEQPKQQRITQILDSEQKVMDNVVPVISLTNNDNLLSLDTPNSPPKCIRNALKGSKVTDYEFCKTLSKTQRSEVYVAKHIKSGHEVVIKLQKESNIKTPLSFVSNINLASSNTNLMKDTETLVLEKLQHPNINKIYQSFSSKTGKVHVLEYLEGGDLFDCITDFEKNNGLPEFNYVKLKQMLKGLDYMHSRGIVHRDIKPENFAFDVEGNIKFIDFGLSCYFGRNNKNGIAKINPVGTIPYMSPELFKIYKERKNLRSGRVRSHTVPLPTLNLLAVDVWALGMVLFTMLTCRIPWTCADPNTSKEYNRFLQKDFSHSPWNNIDSCFLNVVKMMLNPNVKERATTKELLEYIEKHWPKPEVIDK